MATFVLRVCLPDRPGALGAVASRIGAVRGDVVDVQIVEREGGQAVDEFSVVLADDLVPLLLTEIGEVDGVEILGVLPALRPPRDGRSVGVDTAAALATAGSEADVRSILVRRVRRDLGASWAVVVDEAGGLVLDEGDAGPSRGTSSTGRDTPPGDGQVADGTQRDRIAVATWGGETLVIGHPQGYFSAIDREAVVAAIRLGKIRLQQLGILPNDDQQPA